MDDGGDDGVVVVAVAVAVAVVVVVVVVVAAQLAAGSPAKAYRLLVTSYVTLSVRVVTNVATAHTQSLKHPRGECLALKLSLTGHGVWSREPPAISWNHNPPHRLVV